MGKKVKNMLVMRAKTPAKQRGGGGTFLPNRFRIFLSSSPTEDKKKSVFDDVCFICSFFCGLKPRIEILNRYAVLGDRFASVF